MTDDSITEQAARAAYIADAWGNEEFAARAWDESVREPNATKDYWRRIASAALAHQAPATEPTEAATALRDVAQAYRDADRAGFLFLGDVDSRMPWEVVARDLDARAARIAPTEAPATEDETAED